MAVRIAPLRGSDYDAVIDLWRRADLIRRVGKRDERRAFTRQLRVNRGLYFGAFDGGRLVGTVLGTHDSRKGWVNRIAVDPSYQGRGIGTRLLRACEKALVRKGIRIFAALVNEENESSRRLFEKEGYEFLEGVLYVRKKVDPDV